MGTPEKPNSVSLPTPEELRLCAQGHLLLPQHQPGFRGQRTNGRTRCVFDCIPLGPIKTLSQIVRSAEEAAEKRGREAEREACAKIAEHVGVFGDRKDIARVIRSRGQEEPKT